MTMFRRYTFKLYPNHTQAQALVDLSRACAALWNALLQRREDVWRRERRSLTKFDLGREITTLRSACPEWAAISRCVADGVNASLDEAFRAFFRRAKAGAGGASGYPRYKRVIDGASISYERTTKGGFSLRPVGRRWALQLATVPGEIVTRGRFPRPPIATKNASIFRRDGSWWLSICVDLPTALTGGAGTTTIRMDLVDRFATVSIVADGGCAAVASESHPLSEARKPVIREGSATSPGGNLPDGGLPQEALRAEDGGDAGGNLPDGGLPQGTLERLSSAITGGNLPDGGLPQECRTPPFRQPTGGNLPNEGLPQGTFNRTSPPSSGWNLPNFSEAHRLERKARDREASADRRYGHRRSRRARREKALIAALSARAARIRRDELHRWTTTIVRASRLVTLVMPASISDLTASAAGTSQSPGAAVATVAAVNRSVLSYAPAAARQMLAYKCAEAGVSLVVVDDPSPASTIGRDVSAAKTIERRATRALKRSHCA